MLCMLFFLLTLLGLMSSGNTVFAAVVSETSFPIDPSITIPTLIQKQQQNMKNSCYEGSYAVKLPPFNSCAGFRDCEPGHYCMNAVKMPCPEGYFGNVSSLSTEECSGVCPKGFYCPQGTISPLSNPCGDASVYCPEGSSLPLDVPVGYYTVNHGNDPDSNLLDDVNTKTRSAVFPCPFGTFCVDGIKYSCPAGYYGNVVGQSNPTCSGACPEGFYCPIASVDPFAHPCPATSKVYCPKASDLPLPVGLGYYTVMSEYSFQFGGGYTEMLPCTRGTYCQEGVQFLCPAGRFGRIEKEINSSCTGLCRSGYYCPPGSFMSSQNMCDDTSVFCPAGSAKPTPVSIGHYTVGHVGNGSLEEILVVDQKALLRYERSAQVICEPGYYCLADGIKRKCPPGKYGSTHGLSTGDCTGYCEPGYYCPEGSTSSRQYECGSPDVFCPPGSDTPQAVDIGYYTLGGLNNRTYYDQRKCEPGNYCQAGIKRLCISGFYGDQFGQIIETCSGPCHPGYYCPEGSIAATERFCGDPNRYCPSNSTKPVYVTGGYYSIGGNESTRYAERIAPPGYYAMHGLLYPCPAGYFGAIMGLKTPECSGKCYLNGYYCPVASTSPAMRYCGSDDVFCPAGVVAPIQVKPGFYTTDYFYEVCPPGQWRNLTMPRPYFVDAPGDGETTAINEFPKPSCGLCPEGTFKILPGDDYSLCWPCDLSNSESSNDRMTCACTTVYEYPFVGYFDILAKQCVKTNIFEIPDYSYISWVEAYAGTAYEGKNTSITRYYERVCEPGHYCQDGRRYKCPSGNYGSLYQESNPTCQGVCNAGYYCLHGSVSPQSRPCGGAKYICPIGSSLPTLVPEGYYSNEDVDESFRYEMFICPVGYYCPGDGRRYMCPKGTYTDEEGTISDQCKGPCDRGHYCLEGSPNKQQFVCGNSSVFCPRGSFEPTFAHEGFYSAHSGHDAGEQWYWDKNNVTCSVELPCEPGYYCTKGIKYPCPPGTFGWRYGMTDHFCGGQCAPGYYCPSYILPQPDAPPYTFWPGKPHTRPDELPCGDVNYYCPRGSTYPIRVQGGYYSIGGNYDNKTRNAEAICPPGSYCINSIPYLCPKGYYGDTPGLATVDCSGHCPAGYYCPGGTVNPVECPEGSYSTGTAWNCTPCPGGRTTPMKCKNENTCCYRL